MKKVPADPGRTLVARFEDMARRSPDSPALSFMGESLSYDALNRRANRLAHRLRALGVKRGQLVGLHTHRNADVVVGILGILKAGGAYLPLDPVYPRDRIGFMLEDSRVGVVVTEPALAGTMEGTGAALVLPGDLSDEPETDPAPVNAPDDLAYVIYTSGSTGRPKGVQVTHHNVVRLFDSTDHWYGFGPGDVWTLFHSYSFDFSVWEIWGALLYGGRVVVVPQQVSRSPEEFRTLLLDEGVTVLNQTPSAFRLLIQADMAGPRADYALRYVIFGGEALEFQSLRPWFERYGDARPQLVNMYGITETTVHVTYRPVSLADLSSGQGSVIGEPIPDLTLYILDEAGNPAPVGEVGEMYVGGAGVALGYLDRPDLTAQRFLPDRFSGTPGGRLYRTGDLARRLANGDVEYLGRIDHQVKIRGFRIELGEIEAQIAAFPGVREVIVIAREDSPGDRRLVAYVVAPGADAALAEALRSHLRVNLPDYMVPAHFVRMDALPLTENGKVDRRALPAPDRTAGAADYVAPSTPEEETVARIWGEVLGLERIGVHDNFFELGGHSLLVIDVIQRLRAAGLHVDVSRLFLSPTIAEIAAAATAGGDEVAAPAASIPEGAGTITPDMLPLVELGQDDIARIVAAVPGGAANIQDIYPLAPLQEGMLFHNRMGGAGDPYLVTTVLAAPTREALMGYAAALQKVVDRHDILRTAFLSEGLAEPVQVVLRRAPIRVEDVALDPAAGDIAAQLLARFDPRRYRLDVAEAPVLRLFLAEDRANGRWVMLRIHHHLLEDHTTDEMMSEEIIAILDGRGDGLPAPLPFRDFVVRARRVSQSEEYRSFFKGMLADVEEPTAPFGLTDVIGATAEITESRRRLGAAFADRVRRVATQNRVSAASIFHLAWARVVGKCAGREDVVFGTVLFGRMHAGHNAEKVFGPFINSLPIRVGLAGLSVAEGLRRTHTAMGELLRHEHASLAMAQGCSSLPPGAPLFSALLNFRHLKIRGDSEAANHAMAAAIGRMGLELVKFEERTNYPLELSVDDLGDGFMLEAQAQAPVDPANVCAYMERALEEIVTALEQAPDRPLTEIDILPEAERHRILVEWNDTARSYPGPERLHRLIEAQVARTPDATALEFEGRTLTFAEVNARANQLARVLRARGVGPDTLVGVYAERSFEMVVALVAVLKAGGAYVPLDPSYPADRLANMIEDAKAPVILAQRHIMDGLPAGAGEVIALDPDWAAFAGEDASDLPDTGAPTDLAYVIFTSGSTGRPKGAANEHRGICNRINWMQEEYQLTSEDRVLQKTPFSFDVSVWEFFWPLMTGARLVIARPEGHRDSAYLVELIRATGVTVLHFVPSMLRIFLDDEGLAAGTPIRKVMCSGEALPRELQDRFFARLPGVELHNLYGPTEAAVDVTYWPCRPGDSRAMVPIGYPVANTQMYILDTRMQPVPAGVAGELWIAGIQVGRGYVGRDDLTAQRFLPDPFSDRPGARMYRTGDLARHLPDGAIEYLGRTDFQVKIRGQRIELGEIEAALDRHPKVSQSVVMAREDTPGDLRLAAYVVPRDGTPTAAELREHLSQTLPPYMVPAAFVVLDALPLTPSGKADRRALPAPGPVEAGEGYVAPRTPAEAEIARVWGEVLSIGQVGVNDNFFELGGHSLLAVRVVERLRRSGIKLDVRSLFATPTVAALAASVGEASLQVEVPPNLIPDGCTRITPEMLPLVRLTQDEIDAIAARVPGGMANIQDIYPLAPLQEGFLFHHRMTTEGDLYVMQTLFAFESRAALDRYLEALRFVVARNDVMRTVFLWQGLDQPVQVVCRKAELSIEEVTLDPADGDLPHQLLKRYNLLNYRFDLGLPPMIRIFLCHDAQKDRWLYYQLTHHLMDDQATVNIQESELEAYLHGAADLLPRPSRFRNYVAQARLGLNNAEHTAFYREMLADVDEPTAPFGFSEVLGNGSRIDEVRQYLSSDLVGRIFAAAQKAGVSTASLFHEAFALMIGRLSGREDVVFGTVLLGRMHAGEGADRTLGPCINTLPIRIPLGRAPVKDAIRNTQTLLARVMRHEHAPLSLVQRCSSVPPTVPVFNSILNYRRPTRGEGRVEFAQIAGRPHSDTVVTQVGVTDSDWFSTNIPGREFITFVERTNYPLTLSVDDFGDGLRLVAQVQSPIDPAQVCGYMTQALTEIVTALEAAPDRPLSELNVLGAAEREKLVEAWNDTARDYPRDARVPDLIAAQAAATPARTAVRCGDAALGYGELEALSNRLAHELRARGIGRGDFVGLSVERGVELPALMLGVMKAGAAYVPLDPAFPAERLRFMAEDAELKLLITTGALAAPFALPDGRLLLWDADRAGIDARPGTALPPDPARDAGPLDPAYVIYTSGSTGKPKGVVVPHRAVVNMLSSMAREPGIGADDVLLAVTTLSFDISVLELLLPLTVGATVAVAAREDAADGQALAGLIRRHGATVMQATPVTWRLLLGTGWQAPRPFRALAGGEALPREIAEALIARGVELWNMYGPTETTVWSTCARVTDPAAGITIGRPIANTQVYVLNDSLLPCPVGVAGELCIGGDGVTSGYWKRPDLTAERFIDDPFHPGSGRRLYRTGDSARWREDGTLEHLGRLDFQTKVRGYRIELGEIEAAIMRVPGIAASVVIVREDNPGDQRIVAYMVPKGATEGLAAAVRAELQRGLPDYMVPSAFVLIDALPLTPNAKIDRRALPPPSASDALVTVNAHVAPEGETEEGLARIWQELLGLEKVSVEDDFFELGGHSLLALDMLARVEKRFGIHVPVRAVMEGRTIRRIAQAMGGKLASTLPGGIVRIRPGRTEGALFCMPGLGGVSLQYEPLAAKLHGDRAIYAVEVHDFDGDLSVLQSMQGTAAAIVDRMRQVQPDGPYAVIGYSYGGNLAVEVAAELSRRGLPVDLVCVIDAYVPGAVKTETRWARIGRHLRTLRQLRPKARFDYLKFRVQVRIEHLIGRYLPQSEFQHRLTVAAAHGRRAFQTYVPSRYDGPITLIHATELAEWMEVVDDSGTAGWEGVTGRVDVIDMDCGHFDLLHEPYLSDLAAHVDRLLAGVRRADPGAGTAMPAAAGPVRNAA